MIRKKKKKKKRTNNQINEKRNERAAKGPKVESDPQITHGSDKGSERHKRGMERTNMEKPTMSTKIEKIFYPKIFKKKFKK